MTTTYHSLGLITAVLVREREAATGWTIWCVRCGLTSWHPQDVVHLYCGFCHRFHSGGFVARTDRQPFTEAEGLNPPQMPWSEEERPMPYHYEGERLVFDARTPESTPDPDDTRTVPLPGAESGGPTPTAVPRRLVFKATDGSSPLRWADCLA